MKKIKESIKEIELADISNKLPDIIPLKCKREFSGKVYDIFFCALGFEERCLFIPKKIGDTKNFKCKHAIYFKYSTNKKDNKDNKERLTNAFEKFADHYEPLLCDVDDFTKNLRNFLSQIVKDQEKPKIIFDISSCSSKLLLSVLKILFEFDIYLHIVYSEAATYHPTSEEFEKEPEKWTTEEGFGIAIGVGKVISSPEHPGTQKENPDIIIAFPTFKPERTKAIITYIDEALSIRHKKRIIWIVGDPHMDDETKKKRKEIIRKINKISEEVPYYEICTLNYKKTLEILEQIYKKHNIDFHINISALGSKMQSLGISLFCHIRPEASVYLAVPKEWNPNQYSEDCAGTWQIKFGDVTNIKSILGKVGQLEIMKVEINEKI